MHALQYIFLSTMLILPTQMKVFDSPFLTPDVWVILEAMKQSDFHKAMGMVSAPQCKPDQEINLTEI